MAFMEKKFFTALPDDAVERYDIPDPDVIRVGDTYYLVTTTMHFMPGGEILCSKDLRHWKHAAYLYDTLDGTDAQRLAGEENIYGKGMWAASLRYHQGTFYVCFVANDTHKTYLYTSQAVTGPWEKHTVEGFYHDCSLLFDDDGRIYIVYGGKEIWLTELKSDLSEPKEGGRHRRIVFDEGHPGLGYEGSHFYKIGGRYYVFFIHSRRDRWMRVEACFMADSLDDEFVGGDIFEDTLGYCGQGVAQGGIVDTPDGRWYAILFQDRGAGGRMPVVLPVDWDNGKPVFGIPEGMEQNKCDSEDGTICPGKERQPGSVDDSATGMDGEPFVGSDDFREGGRDGSMMAARWQFNHEPWKEFCAVDYEKGCYRITVAKLCANLTEAPNTITQRMRFPECEALVTVDGSQLNEGDYAGMCALQSCYGCVALTVRDGRYYVVMLGKEAADTGMRAMSGDHVAGIEYESAAVKGSTVRFKISADFWQMKDTARFYFDDGDGFRQIGREQKLFFKLDHFTGCRFGLFAYGTKQTGGQAEFSEFLYLEG